MYNILLLILLLYLMVCKTFETFEIYNPYQINNQDYRISICVPCIPRDIPALPRLLNSIENQTYQPHEIVIRLSETSTRFRKQLQQYFNINYNTLRIRLLSTLEKQTAAQNRNVICENVDGDIISCIDADDTMHYQRCQILNDLFKKYNPKAILHNYKKNYDKNTYKLSHNPTIYLGSELYDWCQNAIKLNLNTGIYPYPYPYRLNKRNIDKIKYIPQYDNLTRGHISFKKEVYNNIQYNTSSLYNRGEDVRFIVDLILHYGRNDNTMLYITLPLTQYMVNPNPPKIYQ